MFNAYPEARQSSTEEFLKLDRPVLEIRLYPKDLVIITIGDRNSIEILKFLPAQLDLYKIIWNTSNRAEQNLLSEPLKRCEAIKRQFKKNVVLNTNERSWYMSVILGSVE
jgi:hypothetical protein